MIRKRWGTGKIALMFLVIMVGILIAGSSSALVCPDLSSRLDKLILPEGKDYTESLQGPFAMYSVAYLNGTVVDIGLDKKRGIINFTPTRAEEGTSSVVLIGLTEDLCISTKLVSFMVHSPPNITGKVPEFDPMVNEGNFIQFSVIVESSAPYTLNWYVDGRKQQGNATFIYSPDYAAAGNHTVSVIAKDAFALSDTVSWNVQVIDMNRAPLLVYSLPDFVMYSGVTMMPYRLYDYFLDPDQDNMTFTASFMQQTGESVSDNDLQVTINEDSTVVLTSRAGFDGKKSLRFIATDVHGLFSSSNTVLISINDQNIVCGDGICFNEDCSTCPEDCGICGICKETWICGEWSDCVFGQTQTRNCKDLSRCLNPRDKPIISRPCLNTCYDGIKNQDEEGVDCGGICSPCPECADGKLNGLETDVDCGGSQCAGCDDGKNCLRNGDCKSKVCSDRVCQKATCFDRHQNQGESGIDCGGPCKKACATCFDGTRNQNEEGIDCGGICSKACPSCDDGIRNQGETGIDCGGPCRRCGGPSKGSITLFIIMGAAVLIILGMVEMRYNFAFRALKLDQSYLLMILFIKLGTAWSGTNPHHRPRTMDALDTLLRLQKKGVNEENLDEKILSTMHNYYDHVFGLSETFKEEQLKYKVKDYPIPGAAQLLLVLHYRDLKKYEERKYKTALDAMRLLDKSIALLTNIKDVL